MDNRLPINPHGIEDFLSKNVFSLSERINYVLIRSRVQKYNTQTGGNLNPIEVSNFLNGKGYTIIAIPEKDEKRENPTEILVNRVSIDAGKIVENDWKTYLGKGVKLTPEKEEEAQQVIEILLGLNTNLSLEDKAQWDFIIDFFVQGFSGKISDSYTDMFRGNALGRLQSNIGVGSERIFLENFFPSSSFSYGNDFHFLEKLYKKRLGDMNTESNQRLFVEFLRKISLILSYSAGTEVLLYNLTVRNNQEAERKTFLSGIVHMGHNSVISDDMKDSEKIVLFFRGLLKKIIIGFIKKSIEQENKQDFKTHMKGHLEFLKRYLGMDVHDFLSENKNFVSSEIAGSVLSPERVLFLEMMRRYMTYFFESEILFSDVFTQEELKEFEQTRVDAITQHRESVIRQQQEEREAREATKKLRESSKEDALKYIFGRVDNLLKENKGNIQGVVNILRHEKNGEFSKLMGIHHISAYDVAQRELERIEAEHSQRWERKHTIRWQKVVAVVAEYNNRPEMTVPPFLQSRNPHTQLATSFFIWDQAELISHLPKGVYEHTLESFFENYERVREKQRDTYNEKIGRFYGEDRHRDSLDEYIGDSILEQGIQTRKDLEKFYQSTSAVPAWWLTPDWKKMALLRDDVWITMKKQKLQPKDIERGFQELMTQCDTQLRQITALENSFFDRLDPISRQDYQDTQRQYEELLKSLSENEKSLFDTEGRTVGFYDFISDVERFGSNEAGIKKAYDDMPLIRCMKLSDQLRDTKSSANKEILERRKQIVEWKEKIEAKKQLFVEEFMWTREQREEKREKAKRSRDSFGGIYGDLLFGRGGFF